MKLHLRHARAASAFTMVEIALCLAIVGFALVAIIGVLPAGLNVQKENREDTILNQDSTVWLDAIRAGGDGAQINVSDELTNYVDRIVVSSWLYTIESATKTNMLTQIPIVAERTPGPGVTTLITNGAHIVGLLSTPRIVQFSSNPNQFPRQFVSNYVYAYCRAMSGTATEKPLQDNPDVRDAAFTYRMVVEITPVGSFDPEGIQTNAVDQVLRDNLADARLIFRWPLKKGFVPGRTEGQQPASGNSRMVFRTQISGRIASYRLDQPAAQTPFYFIQPRDYR